MCLAVRDIWLGSLIWLDMRSLDAGTDITWSMYSTLYKEDLVNCFVFVCCIIISISFQFYNLVSFNFSSGVPDAPDNFRSTYQTCISVTLQWLRGFNGRLEQTFTTAYADLNTSDEYTVCDIEDTKDAKIIWKVTNGIFPSHRYRFHVTAVNGLGNSATVTGQDISTLGMFVVNTAWTYILVWKRQIILSREAKCNLSKHICSVSHALAMQW